MPKRLMTVQHWGNTSSFRPMCGNEKWKLLGANYTRKTFCGPKIIHYKGLK